MNYITGEKRREKGRVVEILTPVVFVTMTGVLAALAKSSVSRRINTSFVERQNATDWHYNARKVRNTYTFLKDWTVRSVRKLSAWTSIGDRRTWSGRHDPQRLAFLTGGGPLSMFMARLKSSSR